MILNVSGRTDIVAYYTTWFLNRYKEGFVDVRNPFYPKMISRIYFKDVDLILFCTKNPIPILNHLDKIRKPIIFHVTITPYKKDIEPNVIPKGKIIKAIKQLSKLIGKDNLYIRYDPIFLNERYNLEYHIKAFEKLCMLLEDSVNKIIISFIDDYKNVRKNMNALKIKPLTLEDYKQIGIHFSKSARNHNMTVQTCCEKRDLTEYGFLKEDCLSKELAKQLTGKTYSKWKSRKCNCVSMVDVGAYNTCFNFCKYCYANYDEKAVLKNKNDINSSLIIGHIKKDDIIKVRKP